MVHVNAIAPYYMCYCDCNPSTLWGNATCLILLLTTKTNSACKLQYEKILTNKSSV